MRKITTIIFILMFVLIGLNVASNYKEQAKVDSAMLPTKIEESKGFQRWLTNYKKRMDISADDFTLKDKNEVFNATFLTITNLNDTKEIEEKIVEVAEFKDIDDIAFSPDERQLVDFRHERRNDLDPTDARYLGIRENRFIDSKVLVCLASANCVFDRAYFLDNNTFVISEISRNDVDKSQIEDNSYTECASSEQCSYTFKLHLVDLINNARFVYESKPFDMILDNYKQYF